MTFEIEGNTIHGQITLPASVHKELGIKEGEIAVMQAIVSNAFPEGMMNDEWPKEPAKTPDGQGNPKLYPFFSQSSLTPLVSTL